MNQLKVNNKDVTVKTYQGQPVVTFKDIDTVHERPDGTAGRNFRKNKERFIKEVDYFVVGYDEIRRSHLFPVSDNDFTDKVLLTESGYLLLVKSFRDDLAWKVQRELVNSYFKLKEIVEQANPQGNNLVLSSEIISEAVEKISSCADIFQSVLDYSTINYKQQQNLLTIARERVNDLLGGAHSDKYKKLSRMYFKNLWQDFCKRFDCGSYKDLSPVFMKDNVAGNWIRSWEYSG